MFLFFSFFPICRGCAGERRYLVSDASRQDGFHDDPGGLSPNDPEAQAGAVVDQLDGLQVQQLSQSTAHHQRPRRFCRKLRRCWWLLTALEVTDKVLAAEGVRDTTGLDS